MNELKGGNICGCCYAAQPSGSSSSANLQQTLNRDIIAPDVRMPILHIQGNK